MTHFVAYDCFIGAANIRQVASVNYSAETQAFRAAAAGATADSIISLMSAEPKVTIETGDLSGVIGSVPVTTGLYVSSGSITIPFNKRAAGGTFGGVGAHTELTATNGLCIPTQFSASQDGPATASLELGLISTDGTTSPMSESAAASLSASAFSGAYTIGPVVLNGAALNEVASVTVNTGLGMSLRRSAGGIYPTFVSLNTPFRPRITVGFRDVAAAATITAVSASLTTLAVYFRKRSDGAAYASGSNHISLSFGTGLTLMDTISGDGDSDATVSVIFEGKVLSASAAAALP